MDVDLTLLKVARKLLWGILLHFCGARSQSYKRNLALKSLN